MAKKKKDPHAVHLGQLGGQARKRKLTAERRREIAKKAAQVRWAKRKRNEQALPERGNTAIGQ